MALDKPIDSAVLTRLTQFSAMNKLNKIGYITRDELQQACKQFGLADVHLDDILSEVDKDNLRCKNRLQ